MESGSHGLEIILILLAAALLAATVLNRLRVPTLLAYLVTGLVVGPAGLNLIPRGPLMEVLANLGIVFLLFAIGLDLPLSRLVAMRRFIFGLGVSQVVVTIVVLAGLLALVPLADGGNGLALTVAIAGGFALSSTAAVVRMLIDRRETFSRFGRATIAVLLFQDLSVVPLLSLISALAGAAEIDANEISQAAIGLLVGAAAIGAILYGGRLVLRPLFRVIAGTEAPELFTGLCLLVVLSLGLLAEGAGMSMALGAFLAGLALADTPFRHQVDADIAPFRGLLLGLFFITVGMAIDLRPMLEAPLTVIALTLALITIKAMVAAGLARLFGLDAAQAIRVGFLLAQAGEFTFVVANLARGRGLMDDGMASVMSIVAALSLALSPLVITLGARLAGLVEQKTRGGTPPLPAQDKPAANPVIIAGFGRVGQTVADILKQHDIAYTALDMSAQGVLAARAEGHAVYYGDCRQPGVLRSAGISRASLMVIALDDVAAARATLQTVRDMVPDLPVIARAHNLTVARQLRQAGATDVVPEAIEASIQLAGRVLLQHGLDAEGVENALEDYRRAAEKEATP